MILIRNLTKYILKQPLFEELSLTIQPEDRIGIVGPNGGGKTTLLKIIAGIETADQGFVDTGKERIGYLPQAPEFQSYDTIESYLAAPDYKMEKVLMQVSLTGVDLQTTTTKLSGGQKTKLALAKVLLENPSVLLLDEPTNHLDSSALAWLRIFINEFRGSVLIVSHDRSLLNNVATKIIEIDSINHEANEFTGNYDNYLIEKEKLNEKRENAYSLQERKRKQMEEWIRHRQDIASAIPNPAMGKQIQMMKRRLQREVLDNELNKPVEYNSFKGKSLSGDVPTGKLIIRVQDVAKSLGGKQILKDINFEVRGSERLLISGDNGSGKTTLLKLLTNDLQPDSGAIIIGPNVNLGYFAQEHEILDLEKTVLDEFLSTDRLLIGSRNPRSVLGNFLFKNDDVFKKVKELSLGQRVRLLFAKLMYQQNELLILDEPTNHLDIASKENIEQALQEYRGALIVVSHDKYFIDQIGITSQLVLEQGIMKRV
jgi:ATPase subunit of ABC transporter with duplicated ATPase domains